MVAIFPTVKELLTKISRRYQDPWKMTKIRLLQNVDYFQKDIHDRDFFEELQYQVRYQYFGVGNIIVCPGQEIEEMIIVVEGIIEVYLQDQYTKNKFVLANLGRGAVIGQYSFLSSSRNEQIYYQSITEVQVLKLPKKFVLDHREDINGLEYSIF